MAIGSVHLSLANRRRIGGSQLDAGEAITDSLPVQLATHT